MFTEAVRPICAPGCRPDGHRISRGVRGRVRPLRSRQRLTRQTRMGVPRNEGTSDRGYQKVRHRGGDDPPQFMQQEHPLRGRPFRWLLVSTSVNHKLLLNTEDAWNFCAIAPETQRGFFGPNGEAKRPSRIQGLKARKEAIMYRLLAFNRRFMHHEPTEDELATFERDKQAVMAINATMEREEAPRTRPLTRANIQAQLNSILREEQKEWAATSCGVVRQRSSQSLMAGCDTIASRPP